MVSARRDRRRKDRHSRKYRVRRPGAVPTFRRIRVDRCNVSSRHSRHPDLLQIPPPVATPKLVHPSDARRDTSDRRNGPCPRHRLARGARFNSANFRCLFILLSNSKRRRRVNRPSRTASARGTMDNGGSHRVRRRPQQFRSQCRQVSLEIRPIRAKGRRSSATRRNNRHRNSHAATRRRRSNGSDHPSRVSRHLMKVTPEDVTASVPTRPRSRRVVVGSSRCTNSWRPCNSLRPTNPTRRRHREGSRRRSTRSRVTSLTVTRSVRLIVFRFNLRTLQASVRYLILNLLVNISRTSRFVNFHPVTALRTLLRFTWVPIRGAKSRRKIFTDGNERIITKYVPFVVQVIFFQGGIRRLIVSRLVRSIRLLIRFRRILIRAHALNERLIVNFFRLLLRLMTTIAIRNLSVNALTIHRIVVNNRLQVKRDSGKGTRPRVKRNWGTRGRLIEIRLASLVQLVRLA